MHWNLCLTAGGTSSSCPSRTVEQSACQHIETYDSVPDTSSPNADAEAVLIPMFMDSMIIIWYTEVTVVATEHTLICKTCFAWSQCCLKRALRHVNGMQQCIHRGWLETNVHLCEYRYRCSWSSLSTLRIRSSPVFMLYCLSFSMALVLQLQLCHLHWLVSVQSVDSQRSHLP
jgi:hypothetical protein